ncbi:MAG: hypothetical protein AABY22_18745 [Nanoarchaeota archaeon]
MAKKVKSKLPPEGKPAEANVVDGDRALMMMGDTVLREWRWDWNGYWQEIKW